MNQIKTISKKDVERLHILNIFMRKKNSIEEFDALKEETKTILNKYVTTNWQHNLIFDKIENLIDYKHYFLSDAETEINQIINEV